MTPSENRQNDNAANTKRIVKNTLMLYIRMLLLLAISLYTSRVILDVLGTNDFGVYNAVGGFVLLFSVLSQSLSSAASRFLTYEMGAGHRVRLSRVFSTTLVIHIALALLITVLAELVGVWFVNAKMVIPADRLPAANWVFQFSILSFCVSLITVPHNAAIIAHEKMSAFAYISIFEGIGKLLICFLLSHSPIDRLILYAALMFAVQFISRSMYYIYARRHFEECRFRLVFDRKLLKEIFSFASWNIIGSTSAILRNQGGNVLINLFAGPAANAARALANQVLQAVNGFVESFMTALKPQIVKSYARSDRTYMMTLITQGSRLSYYMLLILCLPILLNTDYILHLWLKSVPAHTVIFVQLTLIFTMIESLSTPLITAKQATGDIRNYQLAVGGLQLLNVPVSYVFLKLGGAPETILWVAIFFAICCLFVRLYMLRSDIQLDVKAFMTKVVGNAIVVSVVATIIPWLIIWQTSASFTTFVATTSVCLLTSMLSVLYVGCSKQERQLVYNKLTQLIHKRL